MLSVQVKIDMEVCALVIDNGTAFCKAGFAGEEYPRVFSTVYGRAKIKTSKFSIESVRNYI